MVLADEHRPAARLIEAQEIKVALDTTQWLELTDDERWLPKNVPTAALKSVSVRKHGLGALEGLGFGLLSGATIGALVGAAAPVESNCDLEIFCTRRSHTFFGAFAGAIPGTLLGTFIGAAIGHRTTVEFDDSPPPPPPPTSPNSDYQH